MDALGAMAGIIGGSVEQQIKQHFQQEQQQQGSQGVPGTSFIAVQSPQLAPQPALSSAYYAQPSQTTADSPQAAGTQAASSTYYAQPAETAAESVQVSSAQPPTATREFQPYSQQGAQRMQASSTQEVSLQGDSAQADTTQEGGEQGDSTEAQSSQGLSRRLLQQQSAGGLATSLANMGTQAFGSLANKWVQASSSSCMPHA